MKIVNLKDVPHEHWSSPGGRFGSIDQQISVALGRDPSSTDLRLRQPFDVELCTIPAGKSACPYHSHSAQWEYYQVLSGSGTVRDKDGEHAINAGDAFIFAPEEAHQLINRGEEPLVMLIVADNPIGETCHYPDSNKWLLRSPSRRLVRSEPLDYLDGEE